MSLKTCTVSIILVFLFNFNKKHEVCSQDAMADELEGPSIDFFEYHEISPNQKTSVVYIDVTDPPPRIVYRRRKHKKKKKNRKNKNRLLFLRNIENQEQNVAEEEPYKNKRIKKKKNKRNGKNKKEDNFRRWEDLPNKGDVKDSSKMSKSHEGDTEKHNPVDIVVHIKMKD